MSADTRKSPQKTKPASSTALNGPSSRPRDATSEPLNLSPMIGP